MKTDSVAVEKHGKRHDSQSGAEEEHHGPHQSATEALLPQTLGTYVVSTFAQATAIFDAMKCSAPANCLAGHLLAAQLDVSRGASTCINSTISDANAFLTSISYSGPGSYTLTASQASQALALESTLDAYTNDSTSATC